MYQHHWLPMYVLVSPVELLHIAEFLYACHVRCSSDGKISFNINVCISLKLRCVEENFIVLCDEHLHPNVIRVLFFLMCNLACHKAKLRKISVHFLWLAAIVRELVTGTEMFLEMLIYSPFNHPRELPA